MLAPSASTSRGEANGTVVGNGTTSPPVPTDPAQPNPTGTSGSDPKVEKCDGTYICRGGRIIRTQTLECPDYNSTGIGCDPVTIYDGAASAAAVTSKCSKDDAIAQLKEVLAKSGHDASMLWDANGNPLDLDCKRTGEPTTSVVGGIEPAYKWRNVCKEEKSLVTPESNYFRNAGILGSTCMVPNQISNDMRLGAPISPIFICSVTRSEGYPCKEGALSTGDMR